MVALQVLWMDESYCAINKPAGWVVHRGWARDTEVLVDLLASQLARPVYPCHRLDRQTSGVLLVALCSGAARAINRVFAAQQVQKRYLALVRGHLKTSGSVEQPLPGDGDGPRISARSLYWPLASRHTEPRETTWVCVEPKTGRTHQVRRHLKHLSHPIIGDANYGKGPLNRAFRAAYALERMALHATSLQFLHPETKRQVEIRAELPDDLAQPLRAMDYDLDELRALEGAIHRAD